MSIQIVSTDEQYRKYPGIDRDEVLKIMEWFTKQPHLPNVTELEALIFYHACYNSVERAKSCMDAYYSVRTHSPEFFANRDVAGADIAAQMKIMCYAPLPNVTHEGYRVVLCKLTDPDPSKFNYVDTNKLFAMIADLWLMQSGIADGHAIVVDMEGCTLTHLTKVNLMAMKKFMFYIQEALPVRLKAFHFINIVSFMDKVMALMRPFLKKELMDAMHLHSTMDTFLEKHVPKAMMPTEYGGSAGPLKELQDSVYKQLLANGPFFVDEEATRRVDEKLRPGSPKTESDLFGIDGNFKQLQFD